MAAAKRNIPFQSGGDLGLRWTFREIANLMDAKAKSFLFDLLNTPSPTGFEIAGQRKWAAYVGQFADAVENDAYGNAWATLESKRSNPLRIMLEAHADEIGFIVKQVAKDGFLHIDRLGGSDVATARGRKLNILGDKGPVRGIIGNTAVHLRKDHLHDEKAPKIHELYVDVGASNPDEVKKLGIRVGHPAVYVDGVEEMGGHLICGRALDNRIGGFIIAQALARLARKKNSLRATVHAVNAVQEEIGGNGAKMVAHRLMPDVCIVLDVTHATDTPGIDTSQHGEVKLGGGPSITHGSCNHPNVVQRLIEVAERRQIPLQHESSSRYSGTDTDVIFHTREGIPSGLVSLPLRYMHSVVESADLRDVEKVIDLLASFVESMTEKDQFAVKL
ncbi:MAG TPA: M42 family metallopeptidase [Chthoniobacteraceae bacterium]